MAGHGERAAADSSGTGRAERARVAYLGPAGTFTEEALLASALPGAVEPVGMASVYDTVLALRQGTVRWAVAPIENSLDGSVTVTLDLLADERGDLAIVGEVLLAVRHSLIAGASLALSEIDTVLSHPQVPGQCTNFLRNELAHAQVLPASSTAEAVRMVSGGGRPGHAALGTALAAEIYGGTVLREGVQDRDDNTTRFVWLARAAESQTTDEGPPSGAHLPPLRGEGGGWKTSVVFWGPGAESPGWLVRCLDEFARRAINLTKIESRPRRAGLGHYMFFVDLEGSLREPLVAQALAGLCGVCEQARVLGSYPTN
jgi:prephenate dehydratase